MHRLLVAEEHSNRIKAARGYAGGISAKELAKRVGVSESTVKRWEGGDDNLSAPHRAAIAKACEVPEWFLEEGFPDELRTSERLEALESQMVTVLGRLAVLSRAVDEESEGGRRESGEGPSGI